MKYSTHAILMKKDLAYENVQLNFGATGFFNRLHGITLFPEKLVSSSDLLKG